MNFKVFHLLTFVFLVKKKKINCHTKAIKTFFPFVCNGKKKSWLYEEELFDEKEKERERKREKEREK